MKTIAWILKEHKLQIAQLYKEGLTPLEIKEKLGLRIQTRQIYRYIKAGGVTRSRKKVKVCPHCQGEL